MALFQGEVFRGSNLRQLEKKVGELLQKMKGKVLALATDQISLSLEPANLGKMLISSEKKNEVVKVSLQFENPQTLEEAKKDMSVLKEHLENSFGGNIELDMGSLSDGQLSSFNDSENNPNDSLAQGLLNKQIEIENQEKTPSHKKAEDAWVDLIV